MRTFRSETARTGIDADYHNIAGTKRRAVLRIRSDPGSQGKKYNKSMEFTKRSTFPTVRNSPKIGSKKLESSKNYIISSRRTPETGSRIAPGTGLLFPAERVGGGASVVMRHFMGGEGWGIAVWLLLSPNTKRLYYGVFVPWNTSCSLCQAQICCFLPQFCSPLWPPTGNGCRRVPIEVSGGRMPYLPFSKHTKKLKAT